MRGLVAGVLGVIAIAAVAGACGGSAKATDDGGVGPTCGSPLAPGAGEATYYDATGAGNCSFAPSPDDLLVAAMNVIDYGTAAWCGGCIEVTGPTGVVTVRIVDKCPGCAKGDVDLSREAFELISPLSAGRVPITWREVACNVSGPVAYQHKDGTSEFYTAIQIRNHRYPIAKLESRDANGAWEAIPRVDYNYFVPADGLGPGPYALHVTDTRGHVLEDLAIPFGELETNPGAAQFPVCP